VDPPAGTSEVAAVLGTERRENESLEDFTLRLQAEAAELRAQLQREREETAQAGARRVNTRSLSRERRETPAEGLGRP